MLSWCGRGWTRTIDPDFMTLAGRVIFPTTPLGGRGWTRTIDPDFIRVVL